ncbi:MAG: hypothetical protein JNG90_06565 [Planctomycetaceae bacterium]|nr:hypothetical protein [Planctomycetaceae bacterium]
MLSRDDLIQTLRERMRQGTTRLAAERISSGCVGLDRLLPAQGFRRGSLVEWVGLPGSGATTLALVAAREASRNGGAVVVVDPLRRFYPPAAASLGIELEKLILVRPGNPRDQQWALTQTLGCRAVAAVLCWPERLESRVGRRWQLAAEQGGSLGLLVSRPRGDEGNAWSEMRLRVEGLPTSGWRRWRVEVLRSRTPGEMCRPNGRSIELELAEEGLIHEAHPLHLAPELAPATLRRRRAQA